MIKIWGRNSSSNVQKAMSGRRRTQARPSAHRCRRCVGKNEEPAYLAINPNGLVPTLEEEDGFLLWESNSIVRHLAGKHDKSGALEPKDAKQGAHLRASGWTGSYRYTRARSGPAFWGLIRTPAEKRDMAAIKTSQEKTTDAMKMLDAQLGKTGIRRGARFLLW